jgi:acyl-CoA dehydrogenase
MDFALNDEQKMMIDTVRRFIAEELHPLEDTLEAEGCLPEAQARAIFEKSKCAGPVCAEHAGRAGRGWPVALDRILCEEQFGHTSDYLIRRAFGNVYEPLLHCKGAQVDRWLKPSVLGQRTCAIAITEPGAGSDAAGIRTRATKTASGWVLNGSKHFISDGEWSDFFLVSAKTGEKEISMFMVDKGLPGFTVGKDQKMMGLRGTPHVELFFDNVPLETRPCWANRARASSWPWAHSTWCGWPRWARVLWARPATSAKR